MPQLISPGVDVSVIDQSFYAGSQQGLVPCIFVATHENKPTPSNDGIAVGTLRDKAGQLYLMTSQRELAQTFGDPIFYRSGGTAVHGDELNEYGLLAAYQFLGVSSRAFIIRANIDLAALQPRSTPPTGIPVSGDYWFDIGATNWGLFRYSGSAASFVRRVPILIDAASKLHFVYQGRRYGGRSLVIGRSTSATEDTAGNPLIDTPGDVVINGTAVAVQSGDSYVDIVDRVNAANIINVRAHLVAYANPTDGAVSSGEPSNIPGVEVQFKLTSTARIDFEGTDADVLAQLGIHAGDYVREPAWNIGVEGDLAVVTYQDDEIFDNRIYEKITPRDAVRGDELADTTAQWMWVGSKNIDYTATPMSYWNWQAAIPTRVEAQAPNFAIPATGSFDIVTVDDSGNEISVTITLSALDTDSAGNVTADSMLMAINNNQTLVDAGVIAAFGDATVVSGNPATEFFITNWKGGAITFANDTANILTAMGIAAQTYGPRNFYVQPHTFSPSRLTVGDIWLKSTTPNQGANMVVKIYSTLTGQWAVITIPFFADDEDAISGFAGALTVGSIYMQPNTYEDGTAALTLRRWTGTEFARFNYTSSVLAPAPAAPSGSLWYDNSFKADIMVSDGSDWLGYRNKYPNADIIFSASAPNYKPGGAPLIENDIWIDSGDLENYPRIYRRRVTTSEWEMVDTTDQTTPYGIVFADARADNGSGSSDSLSLLTSNYVDADAPNALTYPDGLLLFNTRYSSGNVKQWIVNHRFEGELIGDRWVTISGNRNDGAPYMFRKAQRIMIVRAFADTLADNEDVKAETVFFNVMACPGYPETIDEMNNLNIEKKQIAFVIGDTPPRLRPNGTELQNWANNYAEAASTGEEGLVRQSGYEYVGLYYPWGLSVHNDGTEVMVPPSTMMLRTFAYNDQISYPWFPPAGFNRGLISNATTVGYLTSENEFKPTILNQGQRDVLYFNDINPIAYIPNRGLVAYGQKTLYGLDSALDRINVARLANYLRYYLDNLGKPFLFELNNFHTRDAARITFERFLSDLVALQGIYDFIVVCDDTNNTGTRIDRNELWIDCAIQPQKAIEFIYIPVRMLNTSTDLSSFNLNVSTSQIPSTTG